MKYSGMQIRRALGAAGMLLLPVLVQAQPTAHYVPGVEGIKAASLPPPGFYLRDYNVGYYSSTLNDQNGNKVPGITEATIYANVPRFIWITDYELWGGSLGVDALLPLTYTRLNINSGPFVTDNSTFGIGDFFAEGTWSKHIKKFDFSAGAGFWAPTGNSSADPLGTRAGQGYWTAMLTAGATWYPDSEKLWAISVLNRYEFNTEKENADYTPGQAYTLEWGISRTVTKTLEAGVVGYYQQQVTENSGSGNPSGAQRDRVAAIGPEVSLFYPPCKLNISLRYLYEFMAESRLEGHTAALTLTKIF